jgi:hypothetical protein
MTTLERWANATRSASFCRSCASVPPIALRRDCNCSYTWEQRACRRFARRAHVGCLLHRHNSARRAAFGEHAARADIAIGSAIALRRMEYVFVVSVTRPGRGRGATELRQDKSRDMRLGRRAKECSQVSAEDAMCLSHDDVRFQETSPISTRAAHRTDCSHSQSNNLAVPRAYGPFRRPVRGRIVALSPKIGAGQA